MYCYVLCTNYEATNIMTKIPNLFETTSLMMMMLLKRKLLQQKQELSLNTYLTLETWPLNYLYFSTPTKYFSHTSLHIIQNVSRRGKRKCLFFLRIKSYAAQEFVQENFAIFALASISCSSNNILVRLKWCKIPILSST